MSKITLIRGPVLFPKFRPSGAVSPIPPLGLAYLAGTLVSAGHEVTCIDGAGEGLQRTGPCELDGRFIQFGLSLQEIVGRIPDSVSVIGITCMFSHEWFFIRELIEKIRERFPSQLLVLGGEYVTADYEYILNSTPNADACVLGEGEHKIVSILKAYETGANKKDLPGTAVSVEGVVRKNPLDASYRIADVNSIPRPAWDLFPITQYLDSRNSLGSRNHRAMPMLASRGCPYQCTFCSSPQMWTTRWKVRDPADLINEIKDYIQTFHIDRVEFYDLSMFIDKKWIKEFCQRILDEKLGITWTMTSGARTESLDEDILHLLKESGCHRLTYPFETGSKKVNKIIKKKINYEHSLSSLRNAVKAGIVVKGTIIFGFPFQKWTDALAEYVFAIRLAWLGANDISFFSFAPYAGSELHDQLVAEGKIVKDESYLEFLKRSFSGNLADGGSWTPHMSGRTIQILCLLGLIQFYFFQFLFYPSRIIQTWRRIFEGRPLTTLELGLTALAKRRRALS